MLQHYPSIHHKVKLPIEIGEPTEFFAAPIQQLDSKADAGAFAMYLPQGLFDLVEPNVEPSAAVFR